MMTALTNWPAHTGSGVPLHAAVGVDAPGDHVIVPAQEGSRIFVTGYVLQAADPAVLTWRSGATALTGPIHVTTAPIVAGPCAHGHFVTEPGEPLVLELADAVLVGGHLTYLFLRDGEGP
jgi:hypothetical protein